MARHRYGLGAFALEMAMVALAAAFAFPVYILVTLAFKSQRTWRDHPLALPEELYLGNFIRAWNQADLGDALIASIAVVAGSLLVLVALGSAGAYFVARCWPRLGYGLYILFLLGLVLPFIAGFWGTASLYQGFSELCDTMPGDRMANRQCFLRRLVLSWSACYSAIMPVMIYSLWQVLSRT